jgi:hypothetical protein
MIVLPDLKIELRTQHAEPRKKNKFSSVLVKQRYAGGFPALTATAMLRSARSLRASRSVSVPPVSFGDAARTEELSAKGARCANAYAALACRASGGGAALTAIAVALAIGIGHTRRVYAVHDGYLTIVLYSEKTRTCSLMSKLLCCLE